MLKVIFIARKVSSKGKHCADLEASLAQGECLTLRETMRWLLWVKSGLEMRARQAAMEDYSKNEMERNHKYQISAEDDR